jgi:hypothetical protein
VDGGDAVDHPCTSSARRAITGGISMSRMLRSMPWAILIAAMPLSGASAHCVVGARFFPATLNVDDPCVADELSLPTVASFKNGDVPSARQLDVSGEFSKRITDTLGFSVASTWTRLRPPDGPNASGFQNVETTLKYQFLTDAARELVMSVALSVEWGNTGAGGVGAESFSTITPMFFIGKGLGDLPDSARWLRPVAVTGQVGYAIPSKSMKTIAGLDPDTGDPTFDVDRRSQLVVYGGSLQYSLPYLKANVVDVGLPDFINQLIPIIEAQFQTPVHDGLESGLKTTGTVNPGVLWIGKYFQVGVEAIVPINRASGSGVGVIGQLHWYLDDIFPNSIGRPIFAGSTGLGRP